MRNNVSGREEGTIEKKGGAYLWLGSQAVSLGAGNSETHASEVGTGGGEKTEFMRMPRSRKRRRISPIKSSILQIWDSVAPNRAW